MLAERSPDYGNQVPQTLNALYDGGASMNPTGDCLESRAHLTRLPGLADPVLQFDLAKEIEQLRTKESWERGTGRSSETLVKQQDFRIVLILMKANTRMPDHRAESRISIHTLQGRICVHLRDQKIELPAGGLLALDCGLHHDVEAIEESAFLLTISWPKDYATGDGFATENAAEG
jgi:quercetin dioxygenase-like cupin family protein